MIILCEMSATCFVPVCQMLCMCLTEDLACLTDA